MNPFTRVPVQLCVKYSIKYISHDHALPIPRLALGISIRHKLFSTTIKHSFFTLHSIDVSLKSNETRCYVSGSAKLSQTTTVSMALHDIETDMARYDVFQVYQNISALSCVVCFLVLRSVELRPKIWKGAKCDFRGGNMIFVVEI
jgi:hypothetical protein